MILIIGANGSMGRRYQAILRHLRVPCSKIDVDNLDASTDMILNSKKVIIATPTDTHRKWVETCLNLDRDVLCEKPICKSSDEVEYLCNLASSRARHLHMVFQYGEIARKTEDEKPSHYDYFRTGDDGLYWDCLQIISLASGPLKLDNKSPIWKCEINEQELSIQSMDYAYISFIKKWLNDEISQPHKWIIDCHKRVEEYERICKN